MAAWGLGAFLLSAWLVDPEGPISPRSTPTRPLPALTHTAAPGRIQQEAGSAGTEVAAPRVHALRVLAQAQRQALVDICGERGHDQVPTPPHSLLMEGRNPGKALL